MSGSITSVRRAIEAEGIRPRFDETGAAAAIVRHGARVDPSNLSLC